MERRLGGGAEVRSRSKRKEKKKLGLSGGYDSWSGVGARIKAKARASHLAIGEVKS